MEKATSSVDIRVRIGAKVPALNSIVLQLKPPVRHCWFTVTMQEASENSMSDVE